jgi:hypothetical protein
LTWTKAKVGDGTSRERRTFDEWEPALEFYEGLVGDSRVEAARLVEVTEREVRAYEHEPHDRHGGAVSR